MLRPVHDWRFADNYPLEGERRLCGYNAVSSPTPEEDNTQQNEQSERIAPAEGPIENIVSETRHNLSGIDLEGLFELDPNFSQINTINEFLTKNTVAVSEISALENIDAHCAPRETVHRLQQLLKQQAIDTLKNVRHEYTLFPKISYNADENFKERFEENPKNIGKRLPLSFHRFTRQLDGETSYNIYFDAGNRDLEDVALRERTLAHELMHFQVDKLAEKYPDAFLYIKSLLQKAGIWEELQSTLYTLYYGNPPKTEEEAIHEILATYAAGLKSPFPSAFAYHTKIHAIIAHAKTKSENTELRILLDRFMEKTQKKYDWSRDKFEDAVNEKREQREFRPTLRTIKDHCSNEEREAAAESLEEASKVGSEMTPDKLAGEYHETLNKIHDIESVLEDKRKLLPAITSDKRGEHSTAIDVVQKYLNDAKNELDHHKHNIKLLTDWEKGSVTVEQKHLAAENWDLKGKELYELKSTSEQIRSADAKNKIQRNTMVKGAMTAVQQIKEPILKMDEYLTALENTVSTEEKEAERSWFQSMKKFLTVDTQWLSIYDMVKIVTIYKEAVTETYQSQQKIRTHRFVRGSLKNVKSIPWYGQSMDQLLARQVRAADDEETEKYANYIKSEGYTYDELFGSDHKSGLMAANMSNTNRQKAIVEYAAKKGLLYKMNAKNGFDVYGLNFEGLFGEESFQHLISANAQGKDDERKHGAETVKYRPNIPLIMEDIEMALHHKEIYKALGMVDAVQKKAKIGEANTWVMVTIMDAIERHHDLLEIAEIDWFDALGGIGIGESAWSLTQFKTQRSSIAVMKKKRAKMDEVDGLIMGKTIKKIERRLPSRLHSSHHEPDNITRERNQAIAQVLAGQTYEKNGVRISIFEDDFSDYRDYWLNISTTTDPGKTDDDYFVPTNGGSDPILHGSTNIAAIFRRESQGPYVHENKAKHFWAQIFWRYDELKAIGGSAFTNYKKEMQEKLRPSLQASARQTAAYQKFPSDYTAQYEQGSKLKDVSNKNVLDGLLERELIDKETYMQIIIESKKPDTDFQKKMIREHQEEKARNSAASGA